MTEQGRAARGTESTADAEGVQGAGSTPFTVLLPVYAGDNPRYLRRAFTSATTDQQLRPTAVVLVQDGPVRPELAREIAAIVKDSQVPVRHLVLPENVRLAAALQAGLQACETEIVARADADDISEPDRFAVQVPMVAAGLDLVGSALAEFDDDEQVVTAVRRRPTDADAIRAYASYHNPFNHPTVVYRRSAVDEAGGYRDMPYMEDYWLFARMLTSGAAVANVAEPLVRYRGGRELYERRGGLRALRSDWRFQRRARALGLTSGPQMVRNLTQRLVYRVMPDGVRRFAYRLVVARR